MDTSIYGAPGSSAVLQALQANSANRAHARQVAHTARNHRIQEQARDPHMERKARRRAKLEGAHPEIKTLWADLQQVPIVKPQAGPQPASITRKLKSFQLEGLDWMMKQEQGQYKGGLLGGTYHLTQLAYNNILRQRLRSWF